MKPHKQRRAQTALEFLVLVGFMVLVFTTFSFVMKDRGTTLTQQSRYTELSQIAETLNREVVNANRVQDGYERTFELPPTVHGEQYTITFDGKSEVTVRTSNEEYLLFLPVNVTVRDGTGAESANLQPGKNTILKKEGNVSITPALDEIVTCQFTGTLGQQVSCFPSSGGSCTTAPGETTCVVRVTGLLQEKIRYHSNCGAPVVEREFTDEDKTVTLACQSVSETVTCVFTNNPNMFTQTCWSEKGQCAGKTTCPVGVTSLFNEQITWRSSCGGTRTTMTDGVDDTATFTCGNPVSEQVNCLFLTNPENGLHLCYATNNPLVNCTGTSACLLTTNALPGQELTWKSDNCEAYSTTVVTTEEKDVPFLCNVNP